MLLLLLPHSPTESCGVVPFTVHIHALIITINGLQLNIQYTTPYTIHSSINYCTDKSAYSVW